MPRTLEVQVLAVRNSEEAIGERTFDVTIASRDHIAISDTERSAWALQTLVQTTSPTDLLQIGKQLVEQLEPPPEAEEEEPDAEADQTAGE